MAGAALLHRDSRVASSASVEDVESVAAHVEEAWHRSEQAGRVAAAAVVVGATAAVAMGGKLTTVFDLTGATVSVAIM